MYKRMCCNNQNRKYKGNIDHSKFITKFDIQMFPQIKMKINQIIKITLKLAAGL